MRAAPAPQEKLGCGPEPVVHLILVDRLELCVKQG